MDRQLDRLIAPLVNAALARPGLTALLLGLLSAISFPPLALWPVGLAALAGFIALTGAAPNWRSAAWLGWIFGWAQLTIANNWLATAFTFQSNMPAFLGWLAVPLAGIYLAIYPAMAAGIARALMGKSLSSKAATKAERDSGESTDMAKNSASNKGQKITFILALAGTWIITEWLRSWVFSGYPWPPLGLMLLGGFDHAGLAAALPWTGTYALSGLTIVLAGLLGWTFAARRWILLAPLTITITAAMLWPAGQGRDSTLAYTLVQPDVQQADMANPALFDARHITLAELSRRRAADPQGPRIVLWPESSVPDFVEDGYPREYYLSSTAGGDPGFARRRIGGAIGPDSLVFAGLADLEIEHGRPVGLRNTVSVLNAPGEIVGSYDKAHLVPFGEYLPMDWLLEPLGARRLVPGSIDFWPGPGPRTLDMGQWGKAGVQICYEIIFSGQVVDPDNRPDYIFNPSNDGWYGSWGPPQHLAQTRMRAIEEGLPVLRSTTTGISAVIDARGIVRHSIGMDQAARIDGLVPAANPPTLFSKLGNHLAIIWAALFLAVSLVARRRSHR